MILTIRIRTKFPRSLVALIPQVAKWLRKCPGAQMIGWTTEDEVGDDDL